jgi:hypothetical protein
LLGGGHQSGGQAAVALLGVPGIDAIAAALSAWMDSAAAHHLARMELELQGARAPGHADRMTQAAQVFWDICAAIAESLGSDDPERDGRAMAVMLDGLLLDRLAGPPQSQDVVAASLRWLLAGPPPSPN